jgi:flagellar hook-length control protein FliK
MAAQSTTARVSSNTNFASPHEQAPSADSAAPSQALATTPTQNTHSAGPVIVLRAAQGAQGPALPQDRIALAIVRQIEAGVSRFEIRLDPPELGRIDVKMSVRADGHVSAQLTADRPDTLELLQRDARVLQRALSDAGLTMDSGSLSFGLRDRGGRQVFDQDEASSPIAATDAEDETAALPYGIPLTASLEPGRVDLRI